MKLHVVNALMFCIKYRVAQKSKPLYYCHSSVYCNGYWIYNFYVHGIPNCHKHFLKIV